jgi:hypothetical protein
MIFILIFWSVAVNTSFIGGAMLRVMQFSVFTLTTPPAP